MYQAVVRDFISGQETYFATAAFVVAPDVDLEAPLGTCVVIINLQSHTAGGGGPLKSSSEAVLVYRSILILILRADSFSFRVSKLFLFAATNYFWEVLRVLTLLIMYKDEVKHSCVSPAGREGARHG